MKRLLCVIAGLAGAVTLLAQMKETVNVNLVEVPVTVVDSSGNPVRGLTAANFELIDNGTKREITAFDKIDFASTEAMTAISPLNPNARRQFMLLFDLGYATPNALARAQEAARKFVSDSVQPRDLVAVGTIEPDRGFRLLTAFTTDRALIASAIGDPKAFKGTDPLQIASKTEAFTPSQDTTSGSHNEAGAGVAAAEERETAGRLQHLNEAVVRQRIDREVDSLGQLAKMLRAVPGRKQIVLLTEGF
ncbi:MAG TPA: VWA domain-containing protein, partial [Thermoanaerobaculia bacterium]